MKRQLQLFFKSLHLKVGLAALLCLTGCGTKLLETKTLRLQRDLPDETSFNVKLTEYNGNKIAYVLNADKIERFYDRKILHAWHVKIVTYYDNNKIRSTLQADTTQVDEVRNLITASGNVCLTSVNGDVKTQKIIWDRTIDEIVSPVNVLLTRSGNQLRGDNLRTDSAISYVEMNTVSAEGIIGEKDINW